MPPTFARSVAEAVLLRLTVSHWRATLIERGGESSVRALLSRIGIGVRRPTPAEANRFRSGPERLLMRFDQIGHAVETEIVFRRLAGAHGGAEAVFAVPAIDPA